jgi:hypothetical protein
MASNRNLTVFKAFATVPSSEACGNPRSYSTTKEFENETDIHTGATFGAPAAGTDSATVFGATIGIGDAASGGLAWHFQ